MERHIREIVLGLNLLIKRFLSVLCDASTDSAEIENETVYSLYFDLTPIEFERELSKFKNLKGIVPKFHF